MYLLVSKFCFLEFRLLLSRVAPCYSLLPRTVWYTNYLPNCLSYKDILALIFPDNTVLFVGVKTPSLLIGNLASEMNSVIQRFSWNCLVPNLSKTEFMVLGRSKQGVAKVGIDELLFLGVELEG